MSIKPILFSGPMVRAVLEGRKTQTRRVLKTQPTSDDIDNSGDGIIDMATGVYIEIPIHPDDMLWVRENHYLTDDGHNEFAVYSADTEEVKNHKIKIEKMCQMPAITHEWAMRHLKQRPSIHMPRWASRITLKVTKVRVQRLRDISEEDAQAEGIERRGSLGFGPEFIDLWDSLNATRKGGIYAWDKNPWVVAYTFEPIFQNVDQLAAGG